jgi:copper transport protein
MQDKKTLLTGLVSLALVSTLPSTSLAHAYLVRSDPPVGAILSESPEQFRLTFSEPIELKFSSFQLFDAQGSLVFEPSAQLQQDGLQALLDLNPLPGGVYTLTWRVLSAVDGHITQGTIPYAVGVEVLPPTVASTQTPSSPPLVRLLNRWLSLAAAMILVGSLFFPLLLPTEDLQQGARVQRLLWGSWGLFVVTGLVDMFFQSQMIGASAREMITESRWGTIQAARLSFAVALGVLLLSGMRDGLTRWLGRGFAGFLLLATSMSGHSAVWGLPGVLADWVHQMAVAFWVGGLAQLVLIWIPQSRQRSAEERVALLRMLIPRFSDMALISVLLLLGSGIYMVVRGVPSWNALTSTLYGQALLAKHLGLLPVLAVAAMNRFVLKPRMIAWATAVSPNPGPQQETVERTLLRLHKLISAEALMLGAVLFFAGVLTLTAPPAGSVASTAVLQSPQERPQLFLQPSGEYTIALSVSPVRVGPNVFELALTDKQGSPVEQILRVWLDLAYLDAELGSTTVVAQPTADGRYRVSGALLSLPGNWHITVWARLAERAQDLKAEFHLIVEE